MKGRAIQNLWGIAALGFAVQGAVAESRVSVIWRGGDELQGKLLSLDAKGLTLEADPAGLFAAPVRLKTSLIDELRLEMPESSPARTEAFSFTLRNGNRILADVLEVTEDQWSLTGAWIGALKLPGSEIARIDRVQGPGMVLAGPAPGVLLREHPTGKEAGPNPLFDPFGGGGGRQVQKKSGDLEARGIPRELDFWKSDASGALTTRAWDQGLAAPAPTALQQRVPDQLCLEVELSASQRPEFQVRLADGPEENDFAMLETWGSHLALRQGDRFSTLPMPEGKHLHFVLQWQRKTGRLSCEAVGAAWSLSLDPPPDVVVRDSGLRGQFDLFSVVNLGLDLTLHAVRILDAPLRPQAAPAGPAVRRMDGSWVRGRITAVRDGQCTISPPESGAAVTLPLSQVLAIHFAEPEKKEHPPQSAPAWAVSFAGEQWRGQLQEDASAQPGVIRLRGVEGGPIGDLRADLTRVMNFHRDGALPVPDAPGADTMAVGRDFFSHGRLVPLGQSLPGWEFPGAEAAVPIQPRTQTAVTFTLQPERESAASDRPLLQLNDGTLLAARITSITPGSLAFEADGVLRTTLPVSALTAVLFPGPRLENRGFTDAGWQWIGGSAAPQKSKIIELPDGQRLLHPQAGLVQRGELFFHLPRLETSAVRITLGGSPWDAQSGLRLLVVRTGDELYLGEESSHGNLRQQARAVADENDVHLEWELSETEIHLRLNEDTTLRLAFTPDRRAGSMLAIECAEIWGNQPVPITVTGFSCTQAPGALPSVRVLDAVRDQLLTIPRAMRDDPPQHALIAPNGDVLRGTVIALTPQAVRLRSGLDELTIPTRQLAALVWLKPLPSQAATTADPPQAAPVAAEPPAPAAASRAMPPPHWLELRDGSRFAFRPSRWTQDGVTGQHPLLGHFRIAPDRVLRLCLNTHPDVPPVMSAVTEWQLRAAADPVVENAPSNSGGGPLVGQPAPDFKLPGLRGGEITLSSLRGQIVVLDFWATWCGPCLKAVPELLNALEEFPPEQVQVFGINQGEPAAQVAPFLSARGWEWEVALDASQSVARQYQVEGIPHTVVIDREGRIVFAHAGYSAQAAAQVRDVIRQLLKAP
ncbi:MAG: TlpA family protein disulfide reductase [Verrucomicrobiales bacterium]|nr:TlpA family protein disulfide reductase [Verrucomicrobiales bacterium]